MQEVKFIIIKRKKKILLDKETYIVDHNTAVVNPDPAFD